MEDSRTQLNDDRLQSGFALIVVLSSLIILTTLLGVVAKRVIAQVSALSTEETLLKRKSQSAALLRVVAGMDLGTFNDENPIKLGEHVVYIQDVGGLIDLNTASPDLLEIVYTEFEIDAAAQQRLIDWRKSGRRFLRISDFLRVAELTQSNTVELQKIATVHSGRFGISIDSVPPTLSSLLMISFPLGLSENLQTPASGVNYSIFVGVLDSQDTIRIGVVGKSAVSETATVLVAD